ncbi:MAG TPA: asparagine synthase (glutamine-hydrolyzing) [Candidatus Sulfotelmatobacter sp.]|nr:asparagine synthase (glutamine-hydrolyzing) [Candidatus Sulfotelmatobacter sp.]
MCGISGVRNCGDRETLARMNAVQSHRGPNDSGIWEHRSPDGSYIGLASRRLSILDLSTDGHMPMSNEDGTVWITYNGEIYNFRALRRELESKGHRFKSQSDTEVIIHLYEEDGNACVQRLKGMFAFAICDLRGSSPLLFMARDHFGIKPFYYFYRERWFAFASEAKALLEVPGIETKIDSQALDQYLTFLWVPDPKTLFEGIFKLPAGHFAVLRDGDLRISQYWDLSFPSEDHGFQLSEDVLAHEIRERFQHSVVEQMVSDVPVGAFLSAGIDSSSIVATMARTAKHPLRTYTVTFPQKHCRGENTLDDPKVAARLAHQLGCEHQQIMVGPDVAALLPKLCWYMDEPTADPAIIAAYLVCGEASREVTVLLSGVGGDEIFAGYRKYLAHRWGQMYAKTPSVIRHLAELGVESIASFRETKLQGPVRLAKKMLRSAALPAREQFIRNCTYLNFAQRSNLYSSDFENEITGNAHSAHEAAFRKISHADFLNQMLYLDTKIFMASLNLTYNDKMSMACSVEVRVPFLDRELVEFVAWNVPPQMKLKGSIFPTTKHIFRKAMQDIVPAEVLRQPKAGFAVPTAYWLANDLKEMTDDLLADSRMISRGCFRPEAVRKLVREHRSGKADWSMQIWQLLTLELWMQNFLDSRTHRTTNVHAQAAIA